MPPTTGALGFAATDWPRISRLLDEALALPAVARTAWLDGLAADDQRLRATLASLLSEADAPDPELPALGGAAAAASPWRPGIVVGPYRLLRPLGEGGMGSVWLAQRSDGTLARPLALKLPRAVGGFTERLLRERDLLASLAHPHIARLYDAGVDAGGQPYLALEWVAGEPIDRHCRARGLDVPARLRLFLQAAQAVAHAHARLIVHRDIKPSNLLVDGDGEVKLLDFGIAKLLEPTAGDAALTRDDARPMTPDYASPEQVAGSAVDTRSDVYSLGVLLFELLTDTRPYRIAQRGASAVEQSILGAEVPRPSERAATVPLRRVLRGDLDTIVLHALRKDPAARYPTVQAFAEDIERYLQRKPVLARPDSLGYVLRRLLARHRAVFATSSAALLVVLSLAAAALWQAQRADDERRRASEVAGFLAQLLRDASPYRPAAAEARMMAVVARLLRQSERDGSGGAESLPLHAVDLLRRAGRQLDAGGALQPAVRAELQAIVAEGLMNFGDLKAAEAVADRGVAEAERTLAPDHPVALQARLVQAQLWRLAGRPAQAGAALEALLPRLHAAAAAQPALLAGGLQLQALQALDFGVPGEALRFAREADALARQRLGAAHPEAIAAATLRSMAARLDGAGDEARVAAEQALAGARSAWGDGPHPLAAEAAGALGRALADGDDAAGAARAFEAASAQAVALFGGGSPMVALLRANTVPHLLDSGALVQAEARSREALQLLERRLPEQSYPRALAAAARAEVLLALHDDAPALVLLEPAASGLRRHLGNDAPQAVTAELLRLQALLRLGRGGEALASAGGLEVGPRGPRRAPTRLAAARTRALLQHAAGDTRAALRALAALATAPADAGPALRRQAVLSQLALAALHEAEGDAVSASHHWQGAAAAAAPLEGADGGALQAEARFGLARTELAAGRNAAARVHLLAARAIWQRLHPQSPRRRQLDAALAAAGG